MTVSSWYPCFPLVPYTPLSTQKPALCFVNKSDVLKTQGCFPTSLRVKAKLLTIPNQPLCELRLSSGPLILFLVTLLIFCLPKPPRLRAVSHAHQARCTPMSLYCAPPSEVFLQTPTCSVPASPSGSFIRKALPDHPVLSSTPTPCSPICPTYPFPSTLL